MKKMGVLYTALFLFSFSSIFAQFGQNKVQYKEYDWYFIQTKHFDVYFSSNGEKIAEFTAKAAERDLEKLQNELQYEINNRISLIVYDSHNDFQETNTSDEYLSQGIGGFTEPFKNRVVIPFEGNYKKFDHVIFHELVHAVIRDMLYGGTVQNIISKGITVQLPHWYHEGMAEFLSSDWETNTDMFIRDAITNEYLPDINRLAGYFGYRGGQALFHYISEKYGREKVGEILRKVKSMGNLQSAVESTLGLNFEELNTRWKKYLKKRYWPGIAEMDDPDEIAKRLTDNKKLGGFYNMSPAISPQGDKVAFISDRNIYLNVYVMDAFDGKHPKQIIESGTTTDFEELNILNPSLTWAPDNKRIALSGKSSGYDVINIINTETEDHEELPFKMNGIESVHWSHDGNKLAFIGSNAQQSDIYIYNFVSKELSNLTNDIYSDIDPQWSSDGKKIVFASDRGDYGHSKSTSTVEDDFHDFNQTDLYLIDVRSKSIIRLTDWKFSNEKTPVISPNGNEILFVSDKSGIDNIYRQRIIFNSKDTVSSIPDIDAYPITNSMYGINQISTSYDGKKLTFSALYNSGYNIFLLSNPYEMKNLPELKLTNYMDRLVNPEKFIAKEEKELADLSSGNTATSENIIQTLPDSVNENVSIFSGQYTEIDDTTKSAEKPSEAYSQFLFGEDDIPSDTTELSKLKSNMFEQKLDEDGNYLLNRYKVTFSPDLIYANAGYSSLYGLLGTTVLSFSDVLGNHRLVGVTSLQIDLKNSDYGLAYYYLPKRINYGIELFHTARFVYVFNGQFSALHRFRNFGGVVSASFPISRFDRISTSLSMLNVTSENLDMIDVPLEKSTYYIPTISYVHDNVMWGYTSPIQGTRFNFTLFGDIGLTDKRQSFVSATVDYRKYFRFWFDNLFVARVSGGASGGANPQRFFIGGTDNWINRKFATGDVPLSSPSDYAFLSPALPLRGYDYAEQIGTKYALLNLELRMPLIRYLVTGPLPVVLQNILGVAFIDVGSAWDKTKSLQFIARDDAGKPFAKDLLIGTGYGFRTYFLFLWRFDIAWSYDLQRFSKPKFYVSMGLDF